MASYYSGDQCWDLAEQFWNSTQPSPRALDGRVYAFIRDSCFDINTHDLYSKPMVWIGMYIAVASLFCIFAMAADLLHGFRKRKLWFPCRYFTLNAVSITVITVAMKLPVDLNNSMPGLIDQIAKLGSMAFMCTMMANLMPSLASMDNKELVTNVTGFGILVITMVVNISIQLYTGVISAGHTLRIFNQNTFYVYVTMMFFLLIILVSSAITIPISKQILETKYQTAHKTISNIDMSTIEKLRHYVRRYWVMSGTGSPQFVMATIPLCSATGVICVMSAIIYILVIIEIFIVTSNDLVDDLFNSYESDYDWSMVVILITQSVGVVVGTISPMCRSFSTLSFKLSIKSILSRNQFKVFKVEQYWTQKLSDWKQSPIAFLTSGRRSKTLVHNFQNLIISFCIGFDKVIVVSCKLIGHIPIFFVIFVLYYLHCYKRLKAMCFFTHVVANMDVASAHDQNDTNDIGDYVLQLQDDMKLTRRTLKRMSNSVNHLIQKAEKQQPENLLKLLNKFTGFEGIYDLDNDHVSSLQLSIELQTCWSLPVVTLTSIAIALPNISESMVDNLLSGVGEGLLYTRLVEESLNIQDEYLNVQMAAKKLWIEVELHHEWLGINLKAHKGKTSKEILNWLSDKSKEEIQKSHTNEELHENSVKKITVANSMYRVTQSIILNHQSVMEEINEEQLFWLLSTMIADILAACLTNLPRVIEMKCYERTIEKREESVETAAKLLGQGIKIMKKLEEHQLPCMDVNQMAFIDQWHVYLKQYIP